MNHKRHLIFLCVLFGLFSVSFCKAGTTGAICGTVTDKLTGKAIAGATVNVEEIPYRSMSDKNGKFALNQLPPGDYRLQVQMIGYKPVVISDATVKTDTRSRVEILMYPDIIALGEEKNLPEKSARFQIESPAVTRLFPAFQIRENFPVRDLTEILTLHSGSWKSHLRGGRSNETVFLTDGMQMNDPFYHHTNLNIPACAITELVIYSDGFDAEYGQALSGVVNIITDEGKNKSEAFVGLSSDNIAGLAKHYNTNCLEWNWNGPLILGFGGPVINLNYMLAGQFELSDTPWRDEMSKSFESPINRNYSFIGKFNFHLSPTLSLGIGGIFSRTNWREYDYQWKYNLAGLPEFQQKERRINLLLMHEISPSLFYSLRYANYALENCVTGEKADEYSPLRRDSESSYDWIMEGKAQWWEETRQLENTVKADIVKYFSWSTQVKMGVEYQQLKIDMQNSRFLEVPIFGSFTNRGFIGEKNDFNYYPAIFSSYIQSKIRASEVSAHIGLRFEAFQANAVQQDLEFIYDKGKRINLPLKESAWQALAGPRLGITFRLTPEDQLRFNYGWFFQIPPFYCFYKNLNKSFVGNFPLIGNPQLEHEISILYELSYHRTVSQNLNLMISVFQKNLSNLVTTRLTELSGSSVASSASEPLAYAVFENSAHGTISGLEFTFEFKPFTWLRTETGYTLMKATGTSSGPEYAWFQLIWGIQPEMEEVPLTWDRRHSFFAMLNLGQEQKWGISVWAKAGSPLPYPIWGTNVTHNQRLLSWHSYAALKAYFSFYSFNALFSPCFQIDNLFNNKIFIGYDHSALPASFDMNDPTLYEPSRRILVGVNYHYK